MTEWPIDMAEWTMLICPSCGDENRYLHHDRVTVFSRKEDEKSNVTVVDIPDRDWPETTDLDITVAVPPVPENPSSRRSGVVIEGWCELCRERWELKVMQHKGQTWLYIGRQMKEETQ